MYSPIASWIFADPPVLKESCILCRDVKQGTKEGKRQINQGRMRANIDIKANLFHSNVDCGQLIKQTLQMKAVNDIWDTGDNLVAALYTVYHTWSVNSMLIEKNL